MPDPITTAAGAVGVKMFGKAVDDLYAFLKKKGSEKAKKWKIEQKIYDLYLNAAKVRQVKTIWQIDKAVDLNEFYCDSHVIQEKNRLKVDNMEIFKNIHNILVEGIAGQGKSILLRYLCSQELDRGVYIPLFVELRRVSKDHSLQKRIFAAFESLGMEIDDEIFKWLASSGKLLVLLDAFDEVPDDLKQVVLRDIEDLISKYGETLHIVVTSRPNQDIRMSNFIQVVTLDNLKRNEYAVVISKLAKDEKWGEILIDHIKHKATHMVELLCTPLIVTLLVIAYKSTGEFPSNLSDFYDSLFQMLLQRHDGTKPGFVRERRCRLDDHKYRVVFEALCILTKRYGKQSYTQNALYDLTEGAIKRCQFDENPQNYIDDIVKITCLIIRDGDEHRFIHKTVQEYYTASYIKRKPDSWARKYYERVIEQGRQREWLQELEFLSEIDSYRYTKYFLLPIILKILGLNIEEIADAKPVISDDLMGRVFSHFMLTPSYKDVSSGPTPDASIQPVNDLAYMFYRRIAAAISDLPKSTVKKVLAVPAGPGSKGEKMLNVHALLSVEKGSGPVSKAYFRFYGELLSIARKSIEEIYTEESESLLNDLI